MNQKQHLILVKGVDRTSQIDRIELSGIKYTVKFINSPVEYQYSRENILWLGNPEEIDIGGSHVYVKGRKVSNVRSVSLFSAGPERHYAVESGDGAIFTCREEEIDIRESCLQGTAASLFDYFRQCTEIAKSCTAASDPAYPVAVQLGKIYSDIDFIDSMTAAAVYLHPGKGICSRHSSFPIFPFGCNASQKKAVETALSNQLSVIQGPPGTGKTQTILNIVANLLTKDKSVLVVSNNNSATENVLEKLSKNGFGFLVAPLGNRTNKETFIDSQPDVNPELPSWRMNRHEKSAASAETRECLEKITSLFEKQERLALVRQELAEAELEKTHFEKENVIDGNRTTRPFRAAPRSEKVVSVLRRLKRHAIELDETDPGLWKRMLSAIHRLDVDLRLRAMLGERQEITQRSIPDILTRMEFMFYTNRIAELKAEEAALESDLSNLDAPLLMKSMAETSMSLFKSKIADSFDRQRHIFTSQSDLLRYSGLLLKDYPVVLSTTFSSRSCIGGDTLFDYVIMDEASQVSIETGLLALTCAKNAVIVGDTKQLSNVIKNEIAAALKEFTLSAGIPEAYDTSSQSFLDSVLKAVPAVPQTLLREHYRCHPDIIDFCNQKFYGGELVIMTSRKKQDRPLIEIPTGGGYHSVTHYNQREIDAVKEELLPRLGDTSDIGIITPYNAQARAFNAQVPDIEAATVHKYQGREKGTIIMSVTEDVISEFTDDPNLLNVAVSRAKDQFCLVVTGNPQERKGNIHDLREYIRYRGGTVIPSKLRSIYDYLHSRTALNLDEAEKVSIYDSENLTFALLEKIRKNNIRLSHIKTLCHYPLRSLIRETEGLSERERAYAMHPATHIDFLIINRVSKEPLLAVETDGYTYHNEKTEQFSRDRMKDHILEFLGLRLLRLSTVGHSEEQRITEELLRNT